MVSLVQAEQEIEVLQQQVDTLGTSYSYTKVRMIETSILRISKELEIMTGSPDVAIATAGLEKLIWTLRSTQTAIHALQMARALAGDPTAILYWVYFGAAAVGTGIQVYDSMRGL